MLPEASRCLTEGVVRDAADLDLALNLGIGFSSWTGGILRWGDNIGLTKTLEKLEKYLPLGKRYEATEQMRDLAASNRGFYPL
jgi:hypothetical protein